MTARGIGEEGREGGDDDGGSGRGERSGGKRGRVEKASGNTLRCTTGKYKKLLRFLIFFFVIFFPF